MNKSFFQECTRLGVEKARTTLSAITGMPCEADFSNVKCTEVDHVPMLSGYLDDIVFSSWVSFTGEMEGQIIILFRPDSPHDVVSSMVPHFIEEADSENQQELEESIVSEIANMIGCSLLGAIADMAQMTLKPSPPLLIREMAGAILETALATSYLYSGEVFASDVKFSLDGSEAFFEIVLLSSREK
ncbi:MAG: chemotaxis protein CheC [Firmicutes bacterium]|jgi:chemotaxis protein CheY-P-specific phosphatase CheC|nr:chemotaxis protein CheC [Candidatus Fermentithermobacillaceae bacterium]